MIEPNATAAIPSGLPGPTPTVASDAPPPPDGETVHGTYRRLRRAGLSAREAGSLTGHLVGLPSVKGGWSIAEVEGLLFVRALVATGRMGS